MSYPNQYYGGETVVICPNCGAQNAATEHTCRNCGYVLNEQQQPQYQDGQYPQYPDQYQQPQYQEPQYDLAADAQQNKVKAVLAYFGILVLIPVFAGKDSPFARFHANQGLVLWLIGFVLNIVLTVLPVLSPVIGILGLVTLVLSIIGIVNAVKGEMKELPLVGKITVLK